MLRCNRASFCTHSRFVICLICDGVPPVSPCFFRPLQPFSSNQKIFLWDSRTVETAQEEVHALFTKKVLRVHLKYTITRPVLHYHTNHELGLQMQATRSSHRRKVVFPSSPGKAARFVPCRMLTSLAWCTPSHRGPRHARHCKNHLPCSFTEGPLFSSSLARPGYFTLGVYPCEDRASPLRELRYHVETEPMHTKPLKEYS